jgi:hypothetical protein
MEPETYGQGTVLDRESQAQSTKGSLINNQADYRAAP